MKEDISENSQNIYKIIAVDNEIGILDSLAIRLKREGFQFTGVSDPLEAIEMVKNEKFDLMILDYLIMPMRGDEVVQKIREFNKELYILLLTSRNDAVPPLETIKKFDIQGYCEKSNRFDQLILLIESGIKAIKQMNLIKDINIRLKETNDKLEETNSRLKEAYLETIQTLRYTVEAKDPYTRGHSDRVSEYSVLIGQKLNLSEEDIETLRLGGLFHDIGKIGVPDRILLKDSRLSDDEYSEIKNHPTIGAHILSNATIFSKAIPIVKYHHERYDGKGYPTHLSGENIPYLARIAAVADSFDAMTSRRTYRDKMEIGKVKAEIENNRGTQFDPNVANAFLEILENNYDQIEEIMNKYL